MTDENTIQLAINTIRMLSIDAAQQAKSGHPRKIYADNTSVPAAGDQSGMAPAKHPNRNAMKPARVLKSLADLSPEVVGAEAARPAEASPKPSRAGEPQPRETRLPVRAPDHCDFTGYQHWGLNE